MTGTASLIGTEALDEPHCPEPLARATLRDIAVANRLLGGRAAARWGVDRVLDGRRPERILTLLDIGAGGGDIARYLSRRLRRRGIVLQPVLLDRHPAAARMGRAAGSPALIGDARQLPFAPRSVDIVLASQFLHHFSRPAAMDLLRRFDALARVGVVVADLRRAPIAAMGIWLAAIALRFHPVTRRDGVTSVRRGFTPRELHGLVEAAGIRASVARRPGYRIVAAWRTVHAHG